MKNKTPFWVFIDVDGTLIDQNDNPRPFIDALFLAVKAVGGKIGVWSAGGKQYAFRQMQRALEPNHFDMIDLISGKGSGIDDMLIGSKYYIDDHEGLIEAKLRKGYGVFKVSFYDQSIKEDDQELLKAAKAVQAYRFSLN